MNQTANTIDPKWVVDLLPPPGTALDQPSLLRLSVKIACENTRHGGGPFGAVIAGKDGKIIAAGWNNVEASSDSTAHAEIHCIRRAEKVCKSWQLKDVCGAPLTLYSSCAPCIQCYGAIYWSGLARVAAAAPRGYAEMLGFDEGPVSESMWQILLEKKGTEYIELKDAVPDAERPFELYRQRGGRIY